MPYALDNAIFLWEEGERRVAAASDARLEEAVERTLEELRKRLGSTFSLAELADLYGAGTSWAEGVAGAGGESAAAVDAAFGRYAAHASDYAGGAPGK